MLLICAVAVRANGDDSANSVTVSLNAGETYVIDNLKPGTKPSYVFEANPNAFVAFDQIPGKLTLLGAENGHWIVTVTSASDRVLRYDMTSKAIANAAHPLRPGNAPPALRDSSDIDGPFVAEPAAPVAVATPDRSLPELHTISSLATSAASPSSSNGASYGEDATWNQPAPASTAALSYEPAQSIGPLQSRKGQFRNDPSVLEAGRGYESATVSDGKHYMPDDAVTLMTGMSEVIDFPRRITRISIADSKIADVQVINPFQLNLIAHQPGFTTMAVWNEQGTYNERTVRIDASGKQQVMLNTIVAELDRTTLENQGINLSVAMSKMGLSLVGLPGAVATPYSANTSLQGSSTSGTSPSGLLPPGGEIIPLLLSQNMTYGLAAQNGDVIWQAFFQFLEQHSLGKILAEPHLLANSGESAKFLSGGEIPIVIAQALNSSIVFKQFGTQVDFIPTVVGRNDIELLVKTEVSQPDYAHGVQLFGFTVPAFVTRRAETLVRLKDRQTLIIAGLILHEKTSQVQKVPYLGDLPWIRNLFHTTYWQDKESDLVMSVTPEIVVPLPSHGEVFLPSNRGELSSEEIKTKPVEPPDAARPRF